MLNDDSDAVASAHAQQTRVVASAERGSSILIIEDNPDDALLLRHVLARMPPPTPRVTHVGSLAEARAVLAEKTFDAVLTDMDLPDSTFLDTPRAVVAAARGMPVIVLTGSQVEDVGREAVASGAQDYLVKGTFTVPDLRRAMWHARERQRLHVELTAAKSRAEDSLIRLTRLEAMREQLVHMLIHDLRSPLFGMRLYLESLAIDPANTQDAARNEPVLKALEMNARLVEMVSTMLDVHRMEAGAMPLDLATCDLRHLAQEAVEHIGATARGRQIQLAIPRIQVRCDPALIRRVIANLLSNALRYSPARESVVVDGELTGGEAEVRVTDKGRGVPSEHHERIFEKFGSLDGGAKTYSTGLGLPFCKMVVERHGGRVGIRSSAGKGATVWFTLPPQGPSDAVPS
jgi:two-component system sensor histidine kinase/response regulator